MASAKGLVTSIEVVAFRDSHQDILTQMEERVACWTHSLLEDGAHAWTIPGHRLKGEILAQVNDTEGCNLGG